MGESYYAACQSAQEQDMIEAKAVAPFLKDGEQPSECIKRWRADALAVLELLTQEKVKSETLAAEVAKLRAACAAKDAAIYALNCACPDRDAPDLVEAALADTAGTGWIDATGAVETVVQEHDEGGVVAYGVIAPVPDAWAGSAVKIVRVKP